jgi:cell division septation protein DedD
MPIVNAAPARPKPATPTATTVAPVATPKPATPITPAARPDTLVYGIGVASYLDQDRATQELTRLTALSSLPGQVVPFNSSGTTMFRVVLGRYASNGSANRAASDFVAKYGVSEAQPLLLSRHRAR